MNCFASKKACLFTVDGCMVFCILLPTATLYQTGRDDAWCEYWKIKIMFTKPFTYIYSKCSVPENIIGTPVQANWI